MQCRGDKGRNYYSTLNTSAKSQGRKFTALSLLLPLEVREWRSISFSALKISGNQDLERSQKRL
jgi:hypothetical protein